jgi:NAD(P)-dependent dehydrogenase (short-subunit alcohol dehydrogenase family)
VVAPSPVTDLSGRVVVITGGNGGIGLGLAKGCALAGADVMIWGRNASKLEAARQELSGLSEHRVLARQVDVASEEQVDAGMGEVLETLGRLDTVFANAGVSAPPVPFVEQTADQWHRLQAVNADGLFFTLRAGARVLLQQAEGGALVGVSSTSAIHGAPMAQSYAASKAGVLAIMRGLAVELARHNIRCNTIVPGWTETEMTEQGRRNEKFLATTTSRTPIRRWGVPDDFASIGAYLADPTLMYHTGDEIVLDGGYTRF